MIEILKFNEVEVDLPEEFDDSRIRDSKWIGVVSFFDEDMEIICERTVFAKKKEGIMDGVEALATEEITGMGDAAIVQVVVGKVQLTDGGIGEIQGNGRGAINVPIEVDMMKLGA